MQNEVFFDPNGPDTLRQFICVHIDIDKDLADSKAFSVQGIPRMIVQSPQTETRLDIVSTREAAPFAQMLSDSVGLGFSLTQRGLCRPKEFRRPLDFFGDQGYSRYRPRQSGIS